MRVVATLGYERRVRKLMTAAERAVAELEIALAPSRRDVLYLIDVYAKNAKEDLTDAEKQEIRKLAASLEAAP